jgi:hypothetical protein
MILTKQQAKFLLDCILWSRDHGYLDQHPHHELGYEMAGKLAPIANDTEFIEIVPGHHVEQRKLDLLGKRVKAVLLKDDDGKPAVITIGKLLAFGEGGNFEIEEDDGFVHYCWPMLDVQIAEERS